MTQTERTEAEELGEIARDAYMASTRTSLHADHDPVPAFHYWNATALSHLTKGDEQ